MFKFYLKKIYGDHIGSFVVKNQDNLELGRSEGFTVRRRSILYMDVINNKNYEIIPRENDFYFVMIKSQIDCIIKVENAIGVDKLFVKIAEKVRYNFHSLNAKKKYNIVSNKKSIGSVYCDNWVHSNLVTLEIDTEEYINQVVFSILTMGYLNATGLAAVFAPNPRLK